MYAYVPVSSLWALLQIFPSFPALSSQPGADRQEHNSYLMGFFKGHLITILCLVYSVHRGMHRWMAEDEGPP